MDIHSTQESAESVGALFTSKSMEAFVIDFFASLGIEFFEEIDLLMMYKKIFENRGMF